MKSVNKRLFLAILALFGVFFVSSLVIQAGNIQVGGARTDSNEVEPDEDSDKSGEIKGEDQDESFSIKAPEKIEIIENYFGKSLTSHYYPFLIDDFEKYEKKKDGTRYLKQVSPISGYKALYEAIQRLKLVKVDAFKKDEQRNLYFGIEKNCDKLSEGMSVFPPVPLGIWREEIVAMRETDNKELLDGEFLKADEINYLIKFEHKDDRRLLSNKDNNIIFTIIPDGNKISNEMIKEIESYKDKFVRNNDYKHVFIIGKGTGKSASWFSLVILPGDYIVSGERDKGDSYEEIVSKILGLLGLEKKEEESENEDDIDNDDE